MIVAIDTGGTKTLLALFSDQGTLLKSHRFPTPHDQRDYLVELPVQLAEFISDIDRDQIRALALASPGLIKDNTIDWGGGNLQWQNVDVASALRPLLPIGTPVLVNNDARLGGLGEVRTLSQYPAMALYVTISTGIGVGIVTHGRLDPNIPNNEAGHMVLEYDGEMRRWESFGSGKAIKKVYGKFASEIDDPEDWDEIIDRMSRGFLALIPTLQPDLVIIGGSIGTHFSKYGAKLQQVLRNKLDENIVVPPLVQAKNPEEAVAYGGYYYALDYLAQK